LYVCLALLGTDVVKMKSSRAVSPISPRKISNIFCEFPSQKAYLKQGLKKDVLFVLDVQVTFVTLPIVDLPTSSLNPQGMGTQAKTSNIMEHMSTQFQL